MAELSKFSGDEMKGLTLNGLYCEAGFGCKAEFITSTNSIYIEGNEFHTHWRWTPIGPLRRVQFKRSRKS